VIPEDRIVEALASLRTALPSLHLDVNLPRLAIRCSAPWVEACVIMRPDDVWVVRVFDYRAGVPPSKVGAILASMLVSARNEAAARAAAIDAILAPHPAPGSNP
jgi:hypothetical protein